MMDREEALTRTDHFRCTRCGQLSPIDTALCTRPTCRAQLGIYGEIILAEGRVVIESPPQMEKKVKEPKVKKEQQPHVKKEKRPLREKKLKQTSSVPAMPTGRNWMITAVSLLLSALMILLLLRARSELLYASYSDHWRAKYWRYDAQYCLYPVIPILVSMLMVLFFGIRKKKYPVVNVISALFQAVLVGWFMYIWEGARYEDTSVVFCSMCALAVLNCALWLNTLPPKWPVMFLAAGALLIAWGVFEVVIGESMYFDDRFTLLLLEAGILLILTGVRKLRLQKQSAGVSV